MNGIGRGAHAQARKGARIMGNHIGGRIMREEWAPGWTQHVVQYCSIRVQ